MNTKNISVPLMLVKQPIGAFYIGKVKADYIINNLDVNRRNENDGIQRKLSEQRVEKIAYYADDNEATFPTPIIISIKDEFENNLKYNDNGLYEFKFNSEDRIGEIIDGQHRVEGIKRSNSIKEFELVVIFMFNLTEEEKAYIFTTINSNQRSVPKSLIYDLFAVSEKRSPYKTCHEIARLLNTDKKSPFYDKLKMLGIKTNNKQGLSQGAFVNSLVKLISKNPDKDMRDLKEDKDIEDDKTLPLRSFFKNNEDHVIYKILLNLFNAVSKTFPHEWEDCDSYILTRAIGYAGIIKAFPSIYFSCIKENDLSEDRFRVIFEDLKVILKNEDLDLSFDNFPSSAKGENKFKNLIEEAVRSRE